MQIHKQYITRKGSFDSMHRVMFEKMKCFSVHGHTYLYELTFSFSTIEDIGYAIDFKEIKRIGCQWIDDILDHGAILNPKDTIMIEATAKVKSKSWLMSLNGEGEFCNPSVENIAKEIIMAQDILFEPFNPNLRVHAITIYETPNCFTTCYLSSITELERTNFYVTNYKNIKAYGDKLGIVEYDERKL